MTTPTRFLRDVLADRWQCTGLLLARKVQWSTIRVDGRLLVSIDEVVRVGQEISVMDPEMPDSPPDVWRVT